MLVLRRKPGVAWQLPLAPRQLQRCFAAMLQAVDLEDHAAELLVVTDGTMAAYNAAHMGCTGPTNILSFPAADSAQSEETGATPHSVPLLGSLILSAHTLQREALLYGQPVHEHCLRLLAHGLGHIAGYDHGPEMDAFCDEALTAALAALEDKAG